MVGYFLVYKCCGSDKLIVGYQRFAGIMKELELFSWFLFVCCCFVYGCFDVIVNDELMG